MSAESDIPAEAWRQAVQLFTAGDYYACHEVLEEVWLDARSIQRRFLGGMILCAAALHKKLVQRFDRPAWVLYHRAVSHLRRVPDHYHGLDVRQLERNVAAALTTGERPSLPFIHSMNNIEVNDLG